MEGINGGINTDNANGDNNEGGNSHIKPQNEVQEMHENENENELLNENGSTTAAPRCNPIRDRKPPTKFKDFVPYKSKHPISQYMSY